MKKTNITLFALALCLLPVFLTAQSTTVDEAKETKAILDVLEAETQCFFERNYDCWKSNWIDADYAFLAWNTRKGGYDSAIGWKAIDDMMGKYIKDNPLPEGVKASHPNVKRENYRIKLMGDRAAYLTYTQYNSNKTNEYYNISQEVRLLEKVDGQWKIVQMSALWDYNTKVPMEDIKQ